MTKRKLLSEAARVLQALGLPVAQQNERSALCLLALLDLQPGKEWNNAKNALIGITPIMDWMKQHYKKTYAPNTRETIRRQTMHQFVDAGIALYNPDKPTRPVNSPDAVYQIEPSVLTLLRSAGSDLWIEHLASYLDGRTTLVARYAKEREIVRVTVTLGNGKSLALSPGAHSELIRNIVEKFGAIFVKDALLLYAGDPGEKWGYFDEETLISLGVEVDSHGKMPDVVLLDRKRNWVFLVESVTSHGPVDGKRHAELARLFAASTAGIVYVTAFPSRTLMMQYLPQIAWETEVWIAEAPTHLIHFNGDRFLGPHPPSP